MSDAGTMTTSEGRDASKYEDFHAARVDGFNLRRRDHDVAELMIRFHFEMWMLITLQLGRAERHELLSGHETLAVELRSGFQPVHRTIQIDPHSPYVLQVGGRDVYSTRIYLEFGKGLDSALRQALVRLDRQVTPSVEDPK